VPESIPFQTIAVSYVALLLSLSVHECAHAASAYWLEDDTARRLGRMTLNPLAHIDLLGTLVLPLFGMITGWRVLGWAKPVPVDPRNLSRKFSQRIGMAMVAGAGPASNILLSFVCMALLAIAVRVFVSGFQGASPAELSGFKQNIFIGAMYAPVERFSDIPNISTGTIFTITLLGRMVSINIGLAIFNLLPFGPLDGASILRGFLPWRLLPVFDKVQPVVSIVILVLFLVGSIRYILGPLFWLADTFYIRPLLKLFLL
jgi:Zn-dependent protease